jgi:signal transduction histidine kinase
VVVLQDVTKAVESDRAKSEFIATASHELRTPLASLKGFVDVFALSDIDNLSASQRMFLETIHRQTNSMVQLVNDLLEMTRLEQGRYLLERRWVRVQTALQESAQSLVGLAEQRQVTLQTETPDELPSIWIDSLHLRRILTNLLSNAIKYVYRGGQVSIRVFELHDPDELPSPPLDDLPWPHSEERSVVVVVEDDGVGIRKRDQPYIFQRFFRSENPLSVEVGGTGLGLSITKSLVELYEGQIGFSSVESQGSCFWIRLPTPRTDPLDTEHQEVPMNIDRSVVSEQTA